MGYRKTSVLKIAGLFLVAFLMIFSNSQRVSAYNLGNKWETIFKNNRFLFWNPYEKVRRGDQCEDFGEDDPYDPAEDQEPDQPDPEPGDDVWDGHCSGVGSYAGSNGALERFFSAVYDVAKSNGLPWEALLAQIIQESSGGRHEACPFNPLGLKSFKSYPPACDSRNHATFKSYQEAFQYYVDHIIRVREAKGKYPNNPYAYIAFLQTEPNKYAQSPTYVNNVSGLICGIQKWAQSTNKPTSSVTYDRYAGGNGEPIGGNPADEEGTDPNPPVQRRKTAECPEEEEVPDPEIDPTEPEPEPEPESPCEGEECEKGCLTYSQGQALMSKYRSFSPRWVNQNPMLKNTYGISATQSCTSDLENCSAFVKFYIKEKTGVTMASIGNGSQVVGNLISRGWQNGGHTPKPGAVFSTHSGSTMCGTVKCGHTGVVVAISGNTIYIAEAGCSKPFSWTGIHAKSLSQYKSSSYTYAYPPGC
ncbi:glucosaminidase domain-containing protein [Candidatus Saccharibacteria bacterium]|nr:glucosaminidase domain-containing protein [Candidatus Saccharibacteria bacterium]